MQTFRIPYGVATTVRIGSLRSADPADNGDYITPTWQDGDVTTEQDDGSGYENADDVQPGLDGSVIELDVSAAEAAVPAALGGRRIYRFVDQAGGIWIPREICIETFGRSHLAADPMGVVYGCTPANKGAGSITLDAGAETDIHPVGMVAVIEASDEPLDVGVSMLITGWTSGTQVALGADGWTRTPTGTTSSLRVALYASPPNVVALSTQGKADVNAEVVDGINVDTYAEPTAPPTFPMSFKTAILWLVFLLGRLSKRTFNKTTKVEKLRNVADSADRASATLTDDGTTTTVTPLS